MAHLLAQVWPNTPNSMKTLLTFLSIFLIATTSSLCQQNNIVDSIYIIQDSILIPTRSGIDISAIIVKKKANTDPLPVVLFYTTYHQGAGDAIGLIAQSAMLYIFDYSAATRGKIYLEFLQSL